MLNRLTVQTAEEAEMGRLELTATPPGFLLLILSLFSVETSRFSPTTRGSVVECVYASDGCLN